MLCVLFILFLIKKIITILCSTYIGLFKPNMTRTCLEILKVEIDCSLIFVFYVE